MKTIKCILPIILLVILICTNVSIGTTYASTDIYSVAKGMVVLEGNTNTVLYSNNKDLSLPMASTTKIMTAIVCIESCNNLDEVITVSDKAVGIEGTSIYLNYGEQISIRDLLYGLMLASGNDCAVAIAEHCGGSEDNFVKMMNEKIKELGLKNTHFDNPHGLDSENHYTSAYDLAVITSYAYKNDTFREIASCKRHTITKTNVTDNRYLKHKNKLMFQDDNCIGVKTGFTDNAKRCLVSAYEKDNMLIISVVLNCQPMFEECDRLTKLVLDNYKFKTFIKPYNYISSIDVNSGDKNTIGLITIKGFGTIINNNDEDKYRVEYDIPKSVTAPINLNQPIGKVKVYFGNEIIYEDNLYTIESINNTDIKYQIDKIIQNWF